MTTRIAVVTGSNKGIGYAIVKSLCKKFDGQVYLTARDEGRGKKAVEELQSLGLDPKFHVLDIENLESIKTFANYLKSTYGGFDVLVNNAAIAYKVSSTASVGEQAERTIAVNYFATLNVCKELFPLLRPHARIVNMSSSAGALTRLPNAALRERFLKADLTEEQLSDLMNEFVRDAKVGKHEEKGWGNSCYVVSKVGVTALTFIQQKKFLEDSREDIVVNAVHPGYVDTDMSSHKGPLTPEQGAEAPVYLALLPPNVTQPKGEYIWNDKSIAKWS